MRDLSAMMSQSLSFFVPCVGSSLVFYLSTSLSPRCWISSGLTCSSILEMLGEGTFARVVLAMSERQAP